MSDIYLGKKINILSKKIKWGFNFIAEKHGMTGMQSRVLYFILKKETNNTVFQKDIEEEFKLRRSTVTGIVQLMEENNLIIRKVSKEDARVKKIELTDKGRKLQKLVHKDISDYENLLVKNISKEELSVFMDTMEKIYKNLDDFEREAGL